MELAYRPSCESLGVTYVLFRQIGFLFSLTRHEGTIRFQYFPFYLHFLYFFVCVFFLTVVEVFFFFYEVSGGVRRSIDRQSLRRHPENRQSLKLITTRENEIRVTRKVKRPTGATLQ